MTLRRLLSTVATTTNHRITTRFRHLSTTPTPPEEEYAVYNRFLTKGYPSHAIFLPVLDSYYFRLDVPGIHETDLKYSLSGSKLSISAQETSPHPFGSGVFEPRMYEVELEYDPTQYEPKLAKVKVKNGVVQVTVPKLRMGGPEGWVRIYMGNLKFKMEGLSNLEIRCIHTDKLLGVRDFSSHE